MKLRYIIILLALLSFCKLNAQDCYSLLLKHKDYAFKQRDSMALPAETGFYLYPNCIYHFKLNNNKHLRGLLTKIKKDSLVCVNYLTDNDAVNNFEKLDTIAFHYSQLERFYFDDVHNFFGDASYKLTDFEFTFFNDGKNCTLDTVGLFPRDFSRDSVTAYPKPGKDNIYFVFIDNNYYYEVPAHKPPQPYVYKAPDTRSRHKKGFGLTPTRAEVIDGLAFGVFAENYKNQKAKEPDSLTINGLNIELSPLAALIVFYTFADAHKGFDSIALYNSKIHKEVDVKVNGVNLCIGMINESRIKGVNVGAVMTHVYETYGVSISGLTNITYRMKGLSFAAIRNRTGYGRGVQIGLFNRATDFRGVQIGLLNRNGKTITPFINWRFRP